MKNENGFINKQQAILILKFADLLEFEVLHYNTPMYKGSKLGCISALENEVSINNSEDCFKIKQGSLTICHPYEFDGDKPQIRYWFGNQPRIHLFDYLENANKMVNSLLKSFLTVNKIETNF